ncbi:hypothetical protein L3067_13535 [Xanthomonas sp. PPL568]|uniref:hypothetical protein n=1 Tax=Xanthomonas indica TaxID=2912242 RepID=UPI001F5A09D4|nr:hypothetical protein [Xanthomonas indica]MCI2245629.1 hypothetical protein [Xanthomonas indica]
MEKGILYAIQGAAEAKSWAEIWLPPILTILGVLITVLVTAWATLRQLRQQENINAENRRLETKREVVLEGVRGMYSAHAAFGRLSDFKTSDAEIFSEFQEGMSRMSTAGAVASLKTVAAGRDFSQMFGPIFMRMFARRMRINSSANEVNDGGFDLVEGFARDLVNELPALVDMHATVMAAVRQDLGIDKDTDRDSFMRAFKVDPYVVVNAFEEALQQ